MRLALSRLCPLQAIWISERESVETAEPLNGIVVHSSGRIQCLLRGRLRTEKGDVDAFTQSTVQHSIAVSQTASSAGTAPVIVIARVYLGSPILLQRCLFITIGSPLGSMIQFYRTATIPFSRLKHLPLHARLLPLPGSFLAVFPRASLPFSCVPMP